MWIGNFLLQLVLKSDPQESTKLLNPFVNPSYFLNPSDLNSEPLVTS